jgi:UDP-glucose 4-epimerase
MTKIIILGASGFLGTALLNKLQNNSFEVMALRHEHPINHKNSFKGDITIEGILDNYISDDDVVINLIGQYSSNYLDFLDQNLKGGYNLMKSVSKKKNVRLILISSIAVYGNSMDSPSKETDIPQPSSEYANIKLLTENLYKFYAKQNTIDTTILRLSNIYGPTQKSGIIFNCIKSFKDNIPLEISDSGTQLRDFIYIDDAVDGIISSIKYPLSGFNILNISTGIGTKILNVVENIEKIYNKKIQIKSIPTYSKEKSIWADPSYAKKKYNFKPNIKIIQGLRNILMNK